MQVRANDSHDAEKIMKRFSVFRNALLSLSCLLFSAPTGVNHAQRREDLSQVAHLIRIELEPLDLLSKPGEEPYVLGQKVRLRMVAKNESDQRILVRAVNPYYQNRPRLYKEGNLIPYRSQIAKIVSSKDSDPEFVSSVDFIFVEPYSSANLRQLNLGDWYGPLDPGSYRLINRYRFNVGGPWSGDSKPVSFRVVREP